MINKYKKDCQYVLPNFYCIKKKGIVIMDNLCDGCKEYEIEIEKVKE